MVSHLQIVPPGSGRTQEFMPGEIFTWKSVGETNGGSLDFAELALQPGARVPLHIHHGHDEAYYVLRGQFRFKVGDEEADAPVGGFVFIPRGTPHAWINAGNETGVVNLLFTPGGMSGFFDEMAPLLPALMPSMGDMSKVEPELMARYLAVAAKYQYEVVGPPLA